jgi:hypothetical protein
LVGESAHLLACSMVHLTVLQRALLLVPRSVRLLGQRMGPHLVQPWAQSMGLLWGSWMEPPSVRT